MMNPGWRQPDDLHPLEPSLDRDPDVGLTDLIVKNKIFNPFILEILLKGRKIRRERKAAKLTVP